MSGDPYLYPDTDVLRNARGIRDADELRRVEADLTSPRAARLAAQRLPGRYDLAHLRAFHHALFEGLYEWAGELRTVAISRPGAMFALPQHIESYAADVFAQLARERHLSGLSQEAFVERLAHYMGEVNALHPFREGNGRVQRAFFGQLAADAGYRLDWQRIDPEGNIESSSAAMRGDQAPLRALLEKVTSPLQPEPVTIACQLRAAYAEHDRLLGERAAVADPLDTRRHAYDEAITRAEAHIAELEDANDGPLTREQADELRHERRCGRERDASNKDLSPSSD